MIRRDYILRMIEEFLQVLSRLRSFKRGQLWDEAAAELDAEFKRLVASGPASVLDLSETELTARLLEGEPTALAGPKTSLLVALLKEAGDVALAQDQGEKARSYYLKGLNLLLQSGRRADAFEQPEFVPQVDVFVAALAEAPLPLATQAALMEHYELSGQFAKAEDALYAMIEADPSNPGVREFGLAFYERLSHHTDAELVAGNLPRTELEAGWQELTERKPSSQ